MLLRMTPRLSSALHTQVCTCTHMHNHSRKKGREGRRLYQGAHRELGMLLRVRDRKAFCKAVKYSKERKATFRQNYQERPEQTVAGRSVERGRGMLGGGS